MRISNKVTMEGQTIHLSGVGNARQLGGYRTPDGKTIKRDLLLRSGRLSGATEEDIHLLRDVLKLGAVIDFRTTAEIQNDEDPVVEGADQIRLRILNETSEIDSAASVAASFFDSANPVEALVKLAQTGRGITEHTYGEILFDENARTGYGRFLHILAENTRGRAVLWHCTGGKDRAGLAAVLILSALGADRTTILDDFELSNQFYAQNIRDTLARAAAITDDETVLSAVKSIIGVSREYMERTLREIDAAYGSMDRFLRDFLGLSDRKRERLRELYLE